MERFISRIAEAFTNTKHSEKGVLKEVAAKELNALGNAGTFATMEFQLKTPRKLPAKFPAMVKHLWPQVDLQTVTTSQTAWPQHGATCSKGDVALLACPGAVKYECGEIHMHVAFDGTCFALISCFS